MSSAGANLQKFAIGLGLRLWIAGTKAAVKHSVFVERYEDRSAH